MIINSPFSYFPIVIPSPVMVNNTTYIKINKDIYYEDSFDTFKSFKIKINKRGGDTAEINFIKPFQKYNINDSVIFVVKGKTVYRGYIEKILEQGTVLSIIPLWGKLNQIFITDTLELTSTKNIKDVIYGLKSKIEEAGISFDESLIDIPSNKNMVSYDIENSMAGKSIATILEELEDELPSTCIWGVNSNNNFYFKTFNDYTPSKHISWHNLHYSTDEIEEDYSNIYSQYVVKHKKYDATGEGDDIYEVLRYIVGSDEASDIEVDGVKCNFGPIQKWREKVGIKTGTIEYNFESNKYEAYNYAYNMLQRQGVNKNIKLKNLNTDKIRLNINDCVSIITSPKENVKKSYLISGYSDNKNISNNIITGYIYQFGDYIGSSITQEGLTKNIKIEGSNIFNIIKRSLNIKSLEMEYTVSDKLILDDKYTKLFNFELKNDNFVFFNEKEFPNFLTAGDGDLKVEVAGQLHTNINSFSYFDMDWTTGKSTIYFNAKNDDTGTLIRIYPCDILKTDKNAETELTIGNKTYRFITSKNSYITIKAKDGTAAIGWSIDGVKDTIISSNLVCKCGITATDKKEQYIGVVDISSLSEQEPITLKDNKGNTLQAIGIRGNVKFNDIEHFDKYNLELETKYRPAIWNNINITFDQYSEYDILNVREIEYEYEKGMLDINITLSKLNTSLTGYLFEQNKRIKTLEKLLTNSKGERE